MIQEKNLFYKKYLKPNNQETFQAFSQIQERVRLAIEDSKKKCYEKLSNKLSNDQFKGKCYWTILKRGCCYTSQTSNCVAYRGSFNYL